jgi:hypothetical protein
MAKDDLGGIKLHTGQAQPEKPEAPPDPVKPRGVGLKTSEWLEFDKIARELGMRPHALALWALRDFVKRYQAGQIKTKTSKKLEG